MQFDPETREIGVMRALSRDERNLMQLAFAKVAGAERVIDRLFIRSNRIQATETPKAKSRPFLCRGSAYFTKVFWNSLARTIFSTFPGTWPTVTRRPSQSASPSTRIRRRGRSTSSERGHMKIAFVGQLQDQLAMAVQEPAWTLPRLVNWIDRGIPHLDVTKPAARVFIQRALEAVMANVAIRSTNLPATNTSFAANWPRKSNVARLAGEGTAYQALFAADAQSFETSADLALLFDEQSYCL